MPPSANRQEQHSKAHRGRHSIEWTVRTDAPLMGETDSVDFASNQQSQPDLRRYGRNARPSKWTITPLDGTELSAEFSSPAMHLHDGSQSADVTIIERRSSFH